MKPLSTVICLILAGPTFAESTPGTIKVSESAGVIRHEPQETSQITSQHQAAEISPKDASTTIKPTEEAALIRPISGSATIVVEEAPKEISVPKPAPEPAPVLREITFDNIEFPFDQATLLPSAHAEVAQIATILRDNPGTIWVIEGHTDNQGSDAYNMALSLRRANAVIDELVSNYNISSHRLIPRGMGESQSIADNTSEAGRQLNRRVVIIRS